MNSDFLLSRYSERLRRESKKQTKKEIANRLSIKMYCDFMNENFNISKDNLGISLEKGYFEKFSLDINNNVIIEDINLNKLSKKIKKFIEPLMIKDSNKELNFKKEYFFKVIGLGSIIYPNSILFNIEVNDSDKFRSSLRKIYKLKKIVNVNK